MVGEKGIILVEAKEAAAAREGMTFQVFKASPVLMEGAGAGISGSVCAKEFNVGNALDIDVKVGDVLLIGKTVQGFWITLTSHPTGGDVLFKFDEQSYGYEEETPDDCSSREAADTGSLRAKVIGYPCGVTSLPGVDEDGYIELSDMLDWLADRDRRELPGKTGIASRFYIDAENSPDGYGGCVWVIKDINFFRNVINVVDVIDTGDEIDVLYERQSVWDNCTLPKGQILTDDCSEEDDYGDYSI